MSFVKISVHVVWSTKYREPILKKEPREILFHHIKENAHAKDIFLMAIGGYDDHVHCLINLSKGQTIQHTVQLLKGESSNWANKRSLLTTKLIWADDYFAASVSESSYHKVKNYILNQERHHANVPFDHEFESFKTAHGF